MSLRKRNKNKIRHEVKCDVPLSDWQILERYGFADLCDCDTYISRTRGLAHPSHIPYKRRTSRQLLTLNNLGTPRRLHPSSAHFDRLSRANRPLADGWTSIDVQDRLPHE